MPLPPQDATRGAEPRVLAVSSEQCKVLGKRVSHIKSLSGAEGVKVCSSL